MCNTARSGVTNSVTPDAPFSIARSRGRLTRRKPIDFRDPTDAFRTRNSQVLSDRACFRDPTDAFRTRKLTSPWRQSLQRDRLRLQAGRRESPSQTKTLWIVIWPT
jgi:hypothetical protein